MQVCKKKASGIRAANKLAVNYVNFQKHIMKAKSVVQIPLVSM